MSDADLVERTTIRMAELQDAMLLAGLRQRWTTETATAGAEDATFLTRFTDWYQAEGAHRRFWLAQSGEEAVGMANLVLFERMPRPGRDAGRWGYLGNMFVLPEHRGLGVGTLLLAAVLSEAADLRLERVVLSPSQPSVPFWRRSGFVDADELLVHRMPMTR